jgi:hypothetical protein
MTTPLSYRIYNEADLPGLLRLWEWHSDWGSLTPEIWKQWYVNTPHGACIVAVAANPDGEIVAQEVFTPSVISVGGTMLHALRLSAPIVHRDFRTATTRSRNHPVICLYNTAMKEAMRQGYRIVYALPDHAWLPFFRWHGMFQYTEFQCVAALVGSSSAAGDTDTADFLTQPAAEFGPEYTHLWSSAQASIPITCGVVRHPEWLRYKNGGHLTIEVRSRMDLALIGYCAVNRKSGLLVDLLARTDEDVVRVLRAAMEFLAGLAKTQAPDAISEVRAMETPPLKSALRTLGFEAVDYMFAFVCTALDPGIASEDIYPERWYIMPGD